MKVLRVPVVKNFHSSIFRPALGLTQPPIHSVPVALRVNWQGREADHSPPSSAEVKKTWIYTSTPPYVSIVKHRYLSVALVRERTTPTDRPPLVGEVSANVCG
jgi:hypothetical protein